MGKFEMPEGKFGRPDTSSEKAEGSLELPDVNLEKADRKFEMPEGKFGNPDVKFESPEEKFEKPETDFGAQEAGKCGTYRDFVSTCGRIWTKKGNFWDIKTGTRRFMKEIPSLKAT